MKANQQSNSPKIQKPSENVNSSQNANPSNLPFQTDSFELAKSDHSLPPANESLADQMKEIRNDKEDYQSKFKAFSEKEQQTMNELSSILKILSQMRRL